MRRAVQLCGGLDVLCERLNVSTDNLEAWLAGSEEPPMPVFIQAVGLILDAMAQTPQKPPSDPSDGGRTDRRH